MFKENDIVVSVKDGLKHGYIYVVLNTSNSKYYAKFACREYKLSNSYYANGLGAKATHYFFCRDYRPLTDIELMLYDNEIERVLK